VSWLTEPDSDWDEQEDRSDQDLLSERDRPPGRSQPPGRSRVKFIARLVAGWLLVSLTVLVLLLVFVSRGPAKQPTGAASSDAAGGSGAGSAQSGPAAGSSPSPSGESVPAGWTLRAADDQTDCAAHSYGEVAAFFTKTPCLSVHRQLATTSQDGRAVLIASSVVAFGTAEQARHYLNLVTSDGTGNISDLLREGAGYPGGPAALPAAAFASRQDGSRVLVAEAGYVQGRSDAEDPSLRATAERAILSD
jgi:hypothetical protein